MKETELKKAYARACQTRGYDPSDGQFKTWKQTLIFFEAEDVERGIDIWFAEETTFPMPAELKRVAERARQERTFRAGRKTFLVAWRCPACGTGRIGFLAFEDRGVRICSSPFEGTGEESRPLPTGLVCGTQMSILTDERLGATA